MRALLILAAVVGSCVAASVKPKEETECERKGGICFINMDPRHPCQKRTEDCGDVFGSQCCEKTKCEAAGGICKTEHVVEQLKGMGMGCEVREDECFGNGNICCGPRALTKCEEAGGKCAVKATPQTGEQCSDDRKMKESCDHDLLVCCGACQSFEPFKPGSVHCVTEGYGLKKCMDGGYPLSQEIRNQECDKKNKGFF